jgi:CRISPR-associated protein Csb1
MSNTLDTTALLANANTHRLILQATLVPVTGDLFQPAGFPDIGHVIYDAPRPDGSKEKVCVMDSAASMANHLEAVTLASKETLELHPDLAGMPYVECVTDAPNTSEGTTPTRRVVTSLSEGHRLASSYFLDDKGKLVTDGAVSQITFASVLRGSFGIQDLGKKTHPLPGDWWNVFSSIFRYDPNSLVHGILFPAMGIKISRVLTAHHEAFGAERVGLSGVKFDKLGKTTSGQPIFSVDKETAREIRATFVIDLSLIRSFGRGTNGLSDNQKLFLLELALWKIGRLLSGPYRYRSGCDLKLAALTRLENGVTTELPVTLLQRDIATAINNAGFSDPRITQVYWPSEELFKGGSDEEDKKKDGEDDDETDSTND